LRGRRIDEQRQAGVKSDALAFSFGGRMTEPVMPDGLEAPGQHVAQVASHKLHAGHGLGADDVAVGTVLPSEGDVGVGDRILWASGMKKSGRSSAGRVKVTMK
jgi:hypothetical protein